MEDWQDSDGDLPNIKVQIDNKDASEELEASEEDEELILNEDRIEEIMKGSEEEKFLQFESSFWEMFFKHRRNEAEIASRALEFLPEPADVSEVVLFKYPPMEIYDYNHTSGVKMCGGNILGFRCYRKRWVDAVKFWKEGQENEKVEEIEDRMRNVKVEEVSRNEVEVKEQAVEGRETQDQVLERIRASDRKRRKAQDKEERKKARGRDQ